MFRMNVMSNVALVADRFRNIARKRTNFAVAMALSKTAVKVKAAQVVEMKEKFDRPTPYTLNSVYTRPAIPSRLSARVWLKDETSKGTPATKYLAPQIDGGQRNLKRFERALLAKKLLPSGMVAVPASGAQFDAHGNVSRGQIVQILSYLNAFAEVGYSANMNEKRRKSFRRRTSKSYFVGRPGNGRLPLGIWQRHRTTWGTAVRPVFLFVRSPTYKARRFDFFGVAERVVHQEFPRELDAAFDYILNTQ